MRIFVVTNKHKRLEGDFLNLLQHLAAKGLCKADSGRFIVGTHLMVQADNMEKEVKIFNAIIRRAGLGGFNLVMFTLNAEE